MKINNYSFSLIGCMQLRSLGYEKNFRWRRPCNLWPNRVEMFRQIYGKQGQQFKRHDWGTMFGGLSTDRLFTHASIPKALWPGRSSTLWRHGGKVSFALFECWIPILMTKILFCAVLWTRTWRPSSLKPVRNRPDAMTNTWRSIGSPKWLPCTSTLRTRSPPFSLWTPK